MVIRKANIDDLDAIVRLEGECFVDAWNDGMVASDLQGRSYCIIGEDEQHREIGYASMLMLDGDGELLRICIKKQFRHKGYARQLLQYLIDECSERGYDKIFLEVSSANTSAIGLYAKFGFCQISARKSYYHDGSDALIMVMIL